MKTIEIADGLAGAVRLKSFRLVAHDFRLSPAVAALFALLISAFAGIVIAVMGGVIASILIVSALVVLIVLVDYRIGVALMILTFPFSQSLYFPRELFGIPGANPYNLLAMATLGALLVPPFGKQVFGLVFDKRLLWMIVPLVLAGLNGLDDLGKIPPLLFVLDIATFNGAMGYLMTTVVKPLMLILLSVVVATIAAELRRPEFILWLITASALGFTSLVIVYFLSSGLPLAAIATADRLFLGGIGYHANAIGMILVTVFSMFLFAGSESSRGPLRFWLLVSLIPIGIGIMLTFSRTAFVLFAVIWSWYLLSRKKLVGMLLGLVAIGIIIIALPNPVYDRLGRGLDQGFTTSKADPLTAGRVGGLWLPVMGDMVNDPQSIVVGEGMEAMLWSDSVRSGRALPTGHPHNAYLKTVQDMGLVGVACMILFFRFILGELNRMRRNSNLDASLRGFSQGARVALFAFLIGGMAGYSLTPGIQQMYLWMAFGVALGCRAAERAQIQTRPSSEKPR